MSFRFHSLLAVACLTLAAPASWAALATYSQDFEGLDMAAADALSADGWQVGLTVRDSGGTTRFGGFLGPFAAPNGGAGFSAITSGEGGAAQGNQQLNTFNDYNCCDPNFGHRNGTDTVETVLFQEQTIGAGDIGSIWSLTFDAKLPANEFALDSRSEAFTYIQTLDPNNNFNRTNFITFDNNTLTEQWLENIVLVIDLSDAALSGQILQFGVTSTASNGNPTGVLLDNVNFAPVPVPPVALLFPSGLVAGLAWMRRRKGATVAT